MLRKIILICLAVGLPVAIYLATQHAQIPTLTYSEALQEHGAKSETEQTQKMRIEATAIIDAKHPAPNGKIPQQFYAQDGEQTVFVVNYDGKYPVEGIANGMKLELYGHPHGGEPPVFHCSQIVK
ncbi:hypothetical protein MASR2M18_21020 [Ignavibacteria bacterium]|nr:hypothetical protein [Bacteroidota bacterium]MCZ2131994.1 hypothetical protein [Bacteroidota bacterium]